MAQAAPIADLILIGGVVADRLGRRRVMLGGDALRTATQGAARAVGDRRPPTVLGFAVPRLRLGREVPSPAISGHVPEIASLETRHRRTPCRTHALHRLRRGPGCRRSHRGGGIAGWAIAADGLSYAVSVPCLAFIKLAAPARREPGLLSQLRREWSEFWPPTWLWTIVSCWSIRNALVFGPFLVLGAVVSRRYLGSSSAWGTLLAAARNRFGRRWHREAAGSAASSVARRDARHPCHSVGAARPCPSRPLTLAVPGAFLLGAQLAVFTVLWNTTVQREVPPDVLSRVSSYD